MKITRRRRRCSDFETPKVSCYSKQELLDIAKNVLPLTIPRSKLNRMSKVSLWKLLSKHFGSTFEEDWVPHHSSTSFVPDVPTQDWEMYNNWLSDEEICNVQSLFHREFPSFYFECPLSVDFQRTCQNDGKLCSLSYTDLKGKYTTCGVVINTAPSWSMGEHWVSIFIDLKNNVLYYFDSYGLLPPLEIQDKINKFKGQFPGLVIKMNQTRHQYSDSECGMYCLYFIYFMLNNGNFDKLNESPIPDNHIKELRQYFFEDINKKVKKPILISQIQKSRKRLKKMM